MPIIHNCVQGELEWVNVRLGKVTASGIEKLISSKTWKERDSDGRTTYMYEKIAERLLGHALPGFNSFSTDHGEELEAEARAFAELELGEIRQVGFVETDDGLAGCSPDGLLGDSAGIEIKCPLPTNAVRYAIEGRLPEDYAAQVHGSLWASGRAEWYFLSYARRIKPLLLKVKRDEAICAKIGEAVKRFTTEMIQTMEKLKR